MLPTVDSTGALTRLTAQAEAALNVGETERARKLFGQAGKQLETTVANTRKAPEKNLRRFLAATQYYKGGEYRKAQAVCRRLEAPLLPDEVRPLYAPFLRDVNDRASKDYRARVREALVGHWRSRKYQRVLEVLQDHPYVLDQTALAFVRAVCCEHLGDYRAAALFFADAARKRPDDPEPASMSAGYTIVLVTEGKFAEASEYVQHQLRLIPHPATFACASLLRYHQASKAATEHDRRRFSAEQIDNYEQSWARYQALPPAQRGVPTLRDLMILCLEAAPFALLRLGDKARAREVSNMAVQAFPSAAGPRTVRALITYPEAGAVEDFREAVRLGEPHYYPFYFLAHAALMGGEFGETESWCRRALEARPSPTVEAQLIEWMAIVASQRGASATEVRELFDRAESLDPGSPRIRQNRQVFEEATAAAAQPHPQAWNRTPADDSVEQYLVYEEERLAPLNGQAARTERLLAAMAA